MNLKTKAIYYLGKYIPKLRHRYYEKHGGKYLWGVATFLKDYALNNTYAKVNSWRVKQLTGKEVDEEYKLYE